MGKYSFKGKETLVCTHTASIWREEREREIPLKAERNSGAWMAQSPLQDWGRSCFWRVLPNLGLVSLIRVTDWTTAGMSACPEDLLKRNSLPALWFMFPGFCVKGVRKKPAILERKKPFGMLLPLLPSHSPSLGLTPRPSNWLSLCTTRWYQRDLSPPLRLLLKLHGCSLIVSCWHRLSYCTNSHICVCAAYSP